MPVMPTGTVTFLFTDIEGSTKRWERYPQQMKVALQRHDAILRQAVEANGGYVFKTVGDAFCTVFSAPQDALKAALTAQLALREEQWPEEIGPVAVRAALHTGTPEEWDGDYFGPSVNRVARLLSAGHGGQTLLSLATQELVRDNPPLGVELLDLGERRLKDLFRPEHVFQVIVSGLPSQFPPLKTLDARPNNLPVQPTPLIGREKELAEVSKLLRQQDVRLVTLTGPGGTGKTRLGLQVAADMVDEFNHGAMFVNLAPIIDPDLVVSTIAQTLGVKEAGGTPLVDTLKSYLKGKELLIVLDNFEQVITSASQVADLLSAAPGLKVLVTSRELLQIRGERNFPVPPLALPDRKHLPPLERLTQYEAVRLFIERAVAVKPDFEVNNDNAPAVAEICVRLDGLPLALELAAARIRLLPPQAMLSRLENRLKLLTGGARDMSARQQTLRGAIAWSYDLLSEAEKKLFRRLSIFVGGRTLEAAEAVCNAQGDLEMDVLEGISFLVDKSLLKQEEGVSVEPRFVMLETLHEYAREKLDESGEVEGVRRKHAQHFSLLIVEAEAQLKGPEEGAWASRLYAEYDNIRAALAWALAHDIELALSMAAPLGFFWANYSYSTEGREYLTQVLSRTQTAEPTATRALALRCAGRLAHVHGDLTTALLFMQESLAMAEHIGDKGKIADALRSLGAVARWQGDYVRASELHDTRACFQITTRGE